jgi:hypothetical protein
MPPVAEDTPRTSDNEGVMEEEDNLSATELPIELSESINPIRGDYVEFLKTNLPRWNQQGLWYQTPLSNPGKDKSGSESLESVYHFVCQLDMRMDDDPIRKRVALILLYLEFENTNPILCNKP